MQRVILCGGQTGRAVIYGSVEEIPKPGENVELHNARMVLRWDSTCGGLFGLATNGPKNDTRLTCPVDVVRDTCRQVLTVSTEAEAALDAWPNYQ